MAFLLTLLYTALPLLSPAVLPQAIMELHVADISGGFAIVATLISLSEVELGPIPETWLALGLVIATGLSAMATGWLGSIPGIILGFLPIIFNFYFIVVSCRTLTRVKILIALLFLIAFFILGQGILADHAGNIESPYLDPETIGTTTIYRYRGLGVLNDPNDLAQFLVMLLPLSFLWWKKGNLAGNFLFTIVPSCILLFGIYLTHSRGGIVAIIAVLLFGFKDKLGLVKSAIFTTIATAALLASNIAGGRGMNEDDGGRVAAWVTGLEVFKSHPIFGVGVNNFPEYNPTGLTAHNSYVLSLAETGLVGYFFWMGMIVSGWSGLSQLVAREKAKLIPGSAEEIALASDALATQKAVHETKFESNPWMNRGMPAPEEENKEDLVHMATVMRVSLVALLTSSCFLSRTYSMTVYVLLGMAVALRTATLPPVNPQRAFVLKRLGAVMAASIVFLYLFVRLRGVS